MHPKLTGCVQAWSPHESSNSNALPSPSWALLLRVYPLQTGASGVWESHIRSLPSCGGGNGRAAPRRSSAWEKSEAFLSPPTLLLPGGSGPDSCEKSPGGSVPVELGGKRGPERMNLISDPQPVGSIILDYPKLSLEPWACVTDQGAPWALPAQAAGDTGSTVTSSDTGTVLFWKAFTPLPALILKTALPRRGCHCSILQMKKPRLRAGRGGSRGRGRQIT